MTAGTNQVGQMPPRLIDLHCHFIPPDLPDFATELDDPRWPVLRVGPDDTEGNIMRGRELFRTVARDCWDTTARLASMDRSGVSHHVMSPIPVALTYWASGDPAVAYARHINDWLAEQVRAAGGRIVGLGTVPLQDPDAAVTELERLMGLGLAGIEIGTIVNGTELDKPELRRFFHVAEEVGAAVFVHPMARYHGYRIERCDTEQASFATEMLTDTTVAATALVFGGVLEECPRLRICLSHGGGTFTWAYPRLRYFEVSRASATDEAAVRATLDARVASLYVDTLVFDPAHLDLLKQRYTIDHLVAGSDYPFMPTSRTHPSIVLDQAADLGILTAEDVAQIKVDNALRFLQT